MRHYSIGAKKIKYGVRQNPNPEEVVQQLLEQLHIVIEIVQRPSTVNQVWLKTLIVVLLNESACLEVLHLKASYYA